MWKFCFVWFFTLVLGDVLYTDKDSVHILNHKNFGDVVYLKPHCMLVEFYNSWCGHCIRFAPVWKDFAISIDGNLLYP